MANSMSLSVEQFDTLVNTMNAYGPGAVEKVNETIHNAGPVISDAITPLIRPSGRNWKGKPASATRGAWPQYVTNKPMELTVRTTTKYNYLYFPDDGSNTKKHAGNQRFFERGGESSLQKIVESCGDALESAWEEV